jgi:hypothetical protein
LGKGRRLSLPEDGATVSFGDLGPFASNVTRVYYSSPVTPPSTFDFDMVSGARGMPKLRVQALRVVHVHMLYQGNTHLSYILFNRIWQGSGKPSRSRRWLAATTGRHTSALADYSVCTQSALLFSACL